MTALKPTNLQEISAITLYAHNFEKFNDQSEVMQLRVIEQLFKMIQREYKDKWIEFLSQNKEECLEKESLQNKGIRKADSNDFKWMKLIVDMYFNQNLEVLVQMKIHFNLLKDAEKITDKIEKDINRQSLLKDIALAYLVSKNGSNLTEPLRIADKLLQSKYAFEILSKTQKKHIELYRERNRIIEAKMHNLFYSCRHIIKKLPYGFISFPGYHCRVHSC